MSQFEAMLRDQVETARQNLELATALDLPFEAHLHRARLLDLFDRARRSGLDTTGWVDSAVLSVAQDSV